MPREEMPSKTLAVYAGEKSPLEGITRTSLRGVSNVLQTLSPLLPTTVRFPFAFRPDSPSADSVLFCSTSCQQPPRETIPFVLCLLIRGRWGRHRRGGDSGGRGQRGEGEERAGWEQKTQVQALAQPQTCCTSPRRPGVTGAF